MDRVGTNSIFRILQGTVAVIFSVATVKSMFFSRWISGAGVIIGSITIVAGLEVAYVGFGYTNNVGLRGILGGLMWRKAVSKSSQKI